MADDGPDAGGEARLRAACSPPSRRVRLAAARRERGGDDLLHVRHDREPQGGRLQPPIERASRAGRQPARRDRPLAQGRHPARRADVPRELLGASRTRRRASARSSSSPAPSSIPRASSISWRARRSPWPAGVPTIWIGILALLDAHPKRWDLSRLRQMMVGGSAAPPAHDRRLREATRADRHARVGHDGDQPRRQRRARQAEPRGGADEAQLSYRASQGYALPFFEMRHADDQGRVLPWDGETMGELEVRGPWVAASYMGDEGKDRWTADGWFKTGDVVTIDAEGYVRICDRSKDVIKSGGEWISSVALENALMSHPSRARGRGLRRPAPEVGRAPDRGDRPQEGQAGDRARSSASTSTGSSRSSGCRTPTSSSSKSRALRREVSQDPPSRDLRIDARRGARPRKKK